MRDKRQRPRKTDSEQPFFQVLKSVYSAQLGCVLGALGLFVAFVIWAIPFARSRMLDSLGAPAGSSSGHYPLLALLAGVLIALAGAGWICFRYSRRNLDKLLKPSPKPEDDD